MQSKATSKGSEIASTIVAVIMGIMAIVVVVYSLIHIVSIVTAVFWVGLGFALALIIFLCWNDKLKRFGAKPSVNNKWTWIACLLFSAAELWFRGEGGLTPVSTVLFLRLFVTPREPASTAPDNTKTT